MTELVVIADMMPAMGRVYFGDLRCRVDRDTEDHQRCRIVFFNADDFGTFQEKMKALVMGWCLVPEKGS